MSDDKASSVKNWLLLMLLSTEPVPSQSCSYSSNWQDLPLPRSVFWWIIPSTFQVGSEVLERSCVSTSSFLLAFLPPSLPHYSHSDVPQIPSQAWSHSQFFFPHISPGPSTCFPLLWIAATATLSLGFCSPSNPGSYLPIFKPPTSMQKHRLWGLQVLNAQHLKKPSAWKDGRG